jgi:hypothetical protein
LSAVFAHNRHDADGQPVGPRYIGGYEMAAPLFEAKQEMRIAGQGYIALAGAASFDDHGLPFFASVTA